jgi:hypothetical protein
MANVMNTGDTTLTALRTSLLDLHGELLAVVRRGHERFHGRVGGAGELLQLAAYDEGFAWLRPLSGLLAAVDDGALDAAAAGAAVERLLGDGSAFREPYLAALQASPAAVMAHGRVRGALGRVSGAPAGG